MEPSLSPLPVLTNWNSYVDELDSVDDLERYHPPPLLCLLEEQKGGMGVDDRVSISMIAICPSTGDIVWDEFEGREVCR
jgi:DNA mismatch repair protein MSH3